MDLTVNIQNLTGGNQAWLSSAHGTNSADSVAITVSGGNVTTYGRTLPSGLPICRTGEVNPDGQAGHEVHGFLLDDIDISRGAGTYSGALLWHGQISDAARVAKGLVALTNQQKTSVAANSAIKLV